MKLLTEALTTDPSAHRFETVAGWWEAGVGDRSSRGSTTGPLRFEVDASLQAGDVHLSGRVSGGVDAQCSRCLKRYRQRLADTFRVETPWTYISATANFRARSLRTPRWSDLG